MPAPTRHLGLDLGATKIKWSILGRDTDEWRTLEKDQVRTDASGEHAGVVAQLAGLATELCERAGGDVETVGIAVPSLYVPDTGVVTFLTNVPGDWSATPVGKPLADATGLSTALINDARAFGLAELWFGAGRDVRSFVGLTLGTGIGGGWASAGDLIIEPIRAEMRRRVISTPVERVDVVEAELGTWAGAIGAAVHGAEAAEATPSA